MADYHVGQRVRVRTASGGHDDYIVTVTAVTARTVKTSDGRSWSSLTGDPWGKDKFVRFSRESIRPAKDDEEREIAKLRIEFHYRVLKNRLCQINLQGIDRSQTLAIARILIPEEVPKDLLGADDD